MTLLVKETDKVSVSNVSLFIGKLFSFNNSLKLYHWHIKGVKSYSQHIALDQALEVFINTTDRLVETSYALFGDLDIIIPPTTTPEGIIQHCDEFYKVVSLNRILFPESFSQSILDDYQEALQQLLYRLKRLQ